MASARPWLILLGSAAVLGIGITTLVEGQLELADNVPFLVCAAVATAGVTYSANILAKRRGWTFTTGLYVAKIAVFGVAGLIGYVFFTLQGEWPDGTAVEEGRPVVRLIESSSPIVDDAGAQFEPELDEARIMPETARPETTAGP